MDSIIQNLSKRERDLFLQLFQNGPQTKKALQEALDLSPTTLNRSLRQLLNRELIENFGEQTSTGGRKAEYFAVKADSIAMIGLELSRTTIQLLLLNGKLDVLGEKRLEIDTALRPTTFFQAIFDLLKQWLQACQKKGQTVLGVGVGTVGPVDRKHGVILTSKGFTHPDWQNFSIKEWFEKELKLPCVVDNGANCAILAESLFGQGKHKNRLAYIHCGIGIRSAVISEGKLIRTLNDHEDALGNMRLLVGNKRNTLDDLCGLASLAKNPTATSLSAKAAILGLALANFSRLLNPELLLLSGPSLQLFPSLFEQTMNTFYTEYPESKGVIEFSQGESFPQSSIATGAAIQVITKEHERF